MCDGQITYRVLSSLYALMLLQIKQIPNGQSLDLDKIIMLSKMKGVSASELEGIKSVIEPCTSITNSDE